MSGNLDKLRDWLGANVPGTYGPIELARLSGGQSNPTFALYAAGKSLILRQKPIGPILKGAHAIEREARVQIALENAGFPVGHVHAVCDDAAVFGAPFYVMDRVDGDIHWDSTFPGMARADRIAAFDAMNQAIARLHELSPRTLGLSDYGRPENYVERQVVRWSQQYRDDVDAGRNDDLDFLIDWLPARIPASSEAALIHGDFRVDNLIFARESPAIAAVIDWELSTLGDPIADFAYHLMMYRLPPSFPGGIDGADLAALGLPSEEDYVARYCDRTGRAGIPDLEFYIIYNLFRFAAIIHGIKGRALRGNAASPDAERLVSQLPHIASLARRCAELHR